MLSTDIALQGTAASTRQLNHTQKALEESIFAVVLQRSCQEGSLFWIYYSME
jgi:hypothetical protein